VHTVALLMAGGRGDRMRASGVDLPKPLVPVRGVPLVEHNLHQLLRHGVRHVVVAVPAAEPSIESFVTARLAPMTEAAGGKLRILVETTPLGNIGCAGQLHGLSDAVLAVYADNLTTLDLQAITTHHENSGAALTLATHSEPFKLPYGRLEIVDGRVVGYAEKPTIQVPVCSAITVLGPAALAALPADRPTGLADLTSALLERGESVSAFPHDAAWVDVNDATGVQRAERVLDENPHDFAPRR
jgi:mannose-1-phosphate guanylyltransferase/phosphomannomutase